MTALSLYSASRAQQEAHTHHDCETSAREAAQLPPAEAFVQASRSKMRAHPAATWCFDGTMSPR